MKLKLNVTDTPGFSDAIDNSNWYTLQHPALVFDDKANDRLVAFSHTDWQSLTHAHDDSHSPAHTHTHMLTM